MNKEIIKKGFDAAEQERQERQVQQIKNIVQATLERIDEKTEQRAKIDKEIQLLKKDIDDLKAGRLDRIEERQEIDPDSKRVSLVVIKRVEQEFIPLMPWRSPYNVVWTYNGNLIASGTTTLTTGTMFQNFTGGSYQIGARIINL